jgi:hypothetical protein
MNAECFQTTLLEHLERIADAFDQQNELLEQQNAFWEAPAPDEQAPASGGQLPRHLSLFLENLPTRDYNYLRQKLIPAHLACKILGISPAQLTCLDNHNFIKGKGGRYDVVSLLMWLDSDYNPDTEASHVQ